MQNLGNELSAELHFQPFELNPDMPKGGQDIAELLARKSGITSQQLAATRETIRQRGAELGFVFSKEGRDRIYNTFDAHRLLHWAGLPATNPPGRQHALKRALLEAYFSHGECPESHELLLRLIEEVGLDVARAREILASNEYADEVRKRERFYTDAGIHSVPAIIINEAHLISGGQPVEVFERALRQIAGRP